MQKTKNFDALIKFRKQIMKQIHDKSADFKINHCSFQSFETDKNEDIKIEKRDLSV